MRIDGQVAVENVARALTATMLITIGDIATVTARPPAAYGANELARRETLEVQRSTLLMKAQTASSTELRKAHARRKQLESDLSATMAELKAVGVDRQGLRAEIDSLKADVSEIDEAVAAALQAEELTALPNATDIAGRQAELADRREKARRELDRLTGVVDAQNQICTECAAATGRLHGEFDEIRRRLGVDTETLPDDVRDERLATAGAGVETTTSEHQIVAAALLSYAAKRPPTMRSRA